MALDRRYLRTLRGLTFHKLLGTGKGQSFTPRDADLWQWGLLAVGDEQALTDLKRSQLVARWNKRSTERAHFDLRTLSSHGRWAQQEPFMTIPEGASDGAKNPIAIAAITRARIKWAENFRFWKAVPPVTSSLHSSPGLLNTIGIGEAPIGLQGTFSHWKSGSDLRNFAYKGAAHQAAIAATERHAWYAEELFARFAVRDIRGSITK